MDQFDSTTFLLLLSSLVLLLHFLWKRKMKKVAQKGLKYVYPLPLVGNNAKPALNMKNFNLVVDDVYKRFPDERCVAYFNFSNLNIMLRDPDLISLVALKNFDHFVDHYTFLDEELDPLFFYGLFHMNGEKWKDMRASLTPAFTGSKMREMLPFIKDCAKSLVSHINRNIDKDKGLYEVEAKSLMMKSANDTVASCAFGIVTDSLDDPDNQFFKMAEELTQFKPKSLLKGTFIISFPKIAKLLGIRLMSDRQFDYYRNIVKSIMNEREDKGIVRRDMIHLLMLAKKGKLQNDTKIADAEDNDNLTTFFDNMVGQKGSKQSWKDDELTAQALIFLFAGLETTGTLMSYILYELAINNDCQIKLQNEIDEYIEANGEDIDFLSINKLKYLNMVVTETLRIWPSVGVIDRVCTKKFDLQLSNTKKLEIERDEIVMIPIYSLHMDQKYWKDPKKFDPERFSDENKSKIFANTYLPFGVGPRSCIGNRFALMETKIFIFYIISNFKIVVTKKTDIPLPIASHFFAIKSKNGVWVGLERRKRQ